MPQNSDGYPYGYWTASQVANSNSAHAWSIGRDGRLTHDVTTNNTLRGIRPVIVLSKSSLAG